MTSNGNGRLRQILEAAAGEACLPLSDLTVLDKKVDPYRQDTPAGHRDGAWLAEQMARLGIAGPIHLRGLHYALVSSTSLTRPDGSRYLNTADCWEWLQVEAAKAARWLGYVPFDQIVDARNDAPVIVVHDGEALESQIGLGAEIEVRVPDLEDIKPTVYLAGFRGRQKSSPRAVRREDQHRFRRAPAVRLVQGGPLPPERRDHRFAAVPDGKDGRRGRPPDGRVRRRRLRSCWAPDGRQHRAQAPGVPRPALS